MKQLWWWGLTLAWMGMIWWLSAQPNLSSGLEGDWWLRKAAHVAEYAVLMGLWWRVLGKRRVWLAVLVTVGYAMSDELHQSFVIGRHGSGVDVLIDSAGALMAAGGLVWFRGSGRKKLF